MARKTDDDIVLTILRCVTVAGMLGLMGWWMVFLHRNHEAALEAARMRGGEGETVEVTPPHEIGGAKGGVVVPTLVIQKTRWVLIGAWAPPCKSLTSGCNSLYYPVEIGLRDDGTVVWR